MATAENQYLQAFESLNETHSYKGQQWFGERERLVNEFGWAIPNEEVLSYISAAFGEISEVGAGEGYWASLLAKRDVDVHAFDPETNKTWYDVRRASLDSVENWVTDNPTLLIWPPANDGLAVDVLDAQPSHLLYVGETRGGCTANDEFFDRLTDEYEPVHKVELPSYVGVDDNFYHCVRKI